MLLSVCKTPVTETVACGINKKGNDNKTKKLEMISKADSKQWNSFFVLYQALKVLWKDSLSYDYCHHHKKNHKYDALI